LTNSIRFRTLDDSTRGIHHHITEDDKCLYLIEKTSGRDYSFSKANQLISNLKKKPSTSNSYEVTHKANAIRSSANAFRAALNEKWLDIATMVPVPGSKIIGHPDYDDRMGRVCRLIRDNVDVRDLVKQTKSMNASHERNSGDRITLEELLESYEIDENLTNPPPKQIGIFDDVLTAGTHYKAMHTILRARFPDIIITGIFIARRIFPDDEILDF